MEVNCITEKINTLIFPIIPITDRDPRIYCNRYASMASNNVATAEANSEYEYLKEFYEQSSTELTGSEETSLNVSHIGHTFKKTEGTEATDQSGEIFATKWRSSQEG